MTPAFLQFTIVIVAAALISLVFRVLRQPAILAFLVLGALFSFTEDLFHVQTFHLFELFSDLGLTFLLFLVGLEMSTKEINILGKTVGLLGSAQVIATGVLGFALAILLGFTPLTAVYIALALTFSSTVIVVKFLSEKGDTQSLYGKLSIGVLLIQDIVAVLALIFLAAYSPEQPFTPQVFLPIIFKSIFLFTLVYYLSQHFFPKLFLTLARDVELLFLLSLAWALGLAAFVASPVMGFSIEIGGFLAGMALANSAEHYQIASRMRPLRDLFILIFFIYLGTSLNISFTNGLLWWGILLSLFVLVLKPVLILGLMGLMRYKRRTAFMSAVTLSQISEFSLIVVTLGFRLNHLSQEVVGLVTFVGALTMAVSTVAIHHSSALYKRLEKVLGLFERRKSDPLTLERSVLSRHVILIGFGRKGRAVYKALKRQGETVLVVDDDPLVVEELGDTVPFLFGDINDEEIQERANLKGAKLVVSTVMNTNEDLTLLSFFKWKHNKPKVIVTAKTASQAQELYTAGASFVLLPQHVAGEYLAGLIQSKKNFLRSLTSLRKKQLKWLKTLL